MRGSKVRIYLRCELFYCGIVKLDVGAVDVLRAVGLVLVHETE